MSNTEQIVYLLRKTSLTRVEIGKLSPSQYIDILSELYFQESVERWENQYNLAVILAAIYNTIPRGKGSKTLTAKDFYDIPCPVKKQSPDREEKIIKDADIRLPKHKEK